jgi:6-phosphogluconolactonase
MFAYVGSITGEPTSALSATGISVLRVEPTSGRLSCVQSVSGLQSPTYLALHPDRPTLYAGERDWPPMGAQSPGTGAISTFRLNPSDGHLEFQARQASGGPAHLTVHPSGDFVLAAMNRVQQVGVFPVQPDGSVGEPCAIVLHEGRGPRSPNQDRAFPHSCWFDGGARRVLCCDLALDRVMVYELDPESGQLQPASPFPFAQVGSGAGPRHLAVHPNGGFVYVLNELDSTICAFRYEPESAALAIQQTVSMLPDGFVGQSAAAQILVHPNGRYLYASNRGHDSIVIFAIQPDTGPLRLVAHQPSGGERPHNFTIDAAGGLMLVANQRSNTVVSFSIDAETGQLTPTGESLAVQSPTCVVVSAYS